MAVFQREKLRTHRETAFQRLSVRDRGRVLRLAAILQLARAVAASSAIRISAQTDASETALAIDGPRCESEIELVNQCGERWREQIGPLTESGCDASLEPLSHDSDQLLTSFPKPPGDLEGEEIASEGVRRVLRRFFDATPVLSR